MRRCCLCKKKDNLSKGSFFSIPKDERRRKKWSEACQKEFGKTEKICMDHFHSSSFIKIGAKTELVYNAVPSICLFINETPRLHHFNSENIPSEFSTAAVEQNCTEIRQNYSNKGSTGVLLPVENLQAPLEVGHMFSNSECTEDLFPSEFSTPAIEFGQHCTEIRQICSNDTAVDLLPAEIIPAPLQLGQMFPNSDTSADLFRTEYVFSSTPVKLVKHNLETQTFCNNGCSTGLFSQDDSFAATLQMGQQCTATRQQFPSYEYPSEIHSISSQIERKEQGTQTDPVILDYTVDRQSFLEKVRRLDTQIKDLNLELSKANAAIESMGSIFTKGQIKKMKSPGYVKWDWEDISSAICLHASGPRAYKHLYNKGFPLPHERTLQRWCRKVNITEGIIKPAIDFMRHISDLKVEDKACVLSFDEMKVVETFEYDAVGDRVRKPANYVQVVMARGLRKSWKQPIFFDYDQQMSKDILFDLIKELHKVDFPVVAVVCDMGPTNRKLWKDLGVTIDESYDIDYNVNLFFTGFHKT